jgi:ribosomal protein L21
MPAEERARHVVLLGPDGPQGRGAGIEGGWVGGGGGGRRRPEDVEQAFGESLRSRTFYLYAGVGFDEQLGGAVERRVLPYLRDDVLARNACVKATVVLRVESHELDRKLIVFKKKRRKRYQRTQGHRREVSRVRVAEIICDVGAY